MAAAASFVGGVPALLSALLGLGLTTVFFAVGLGALRFVLAGALSMQMVGALAVYAAQVLVLFALLDVVASISGLQGRPFALGALAGVIAWQVGQVVVLLRRRGLIYSGPMPGDSDPDSTSEGTSSSRRTDELLREGVR